MIVYLSYYLHLKIKLKTHTANKKHYFREISQLISCVLEREVFIMKRYCIYAAEQQYGGLHGMNYYGVIEAKNQEEAEDYARERSFEVMNDYGDIMETIEENAKYWASQDYEEGTDEWEKAYNENIEQERNDNLDYYAKEISKEKNEGQGYIVSLDILDNMYWNNPDEFEEKYCINE